MRSCFANGGSVGKSLNKKKSHESAKARRGRKGIPDLGFLRAWSRLRELCDASSTPPFELWPFIRGSDFPASDFTPRAVPCTSATAPIAFAFGTPREHDRAACVAYGSGRSIAAFQPAAGAGDAI